MALQLSRIIFNGMCPDICDDPSNKRQWLQHDVLHSMVKYAAAERGTHRSAVIFLLLLNGGITAGG